jgi:hypothetical protein
MKENGTDFNKPIVPRLAPEAIRSLGRGKAQTPKKGKKVPYRREKRDWKNWEE